MFPDRLTECLEVGTIYVSWVGTIYVLVRWLDGFGFGTGSVSRRSGDSCVDGTGIVWLDG